MNNDQFRRLLLANSAKPGPDKNGVSPTDSRSSFTTPVNAPLGARLKPSSIPMTPRSVAGTARVDLARQLAERNQAFEQTQKKYRSSAPKGSRFAHGYVDRARTRQEEEDERAERLKALEESFKKEEIDRETYDRLRGEIAGGDLSSTHLVKGLDFKLLERIRRGEDVYTDKQPPPKAGHEREGDAQDGGEGEREDPNGDPDEILEQLESTEVKAIEREKVQKKGQLATAALHPGQQRTRNQILAEWKAARAATKAKPESSLGSKFKKIGERKTPGTRIERDSKGREVLIIVDEDGNEKRKVRKLDPSTVDEQERERELLASGKVLGMEVPEFYRKQLEAQQAEEASKEVSIFDDAGSDYDPLAGLEGSDESSGDEGDGKAEDETAEKPSADMRPPPRPEMSAARNYFKDSKTGLTSEETYKAPSLDDPAFLAALKKAKAASALEKSEEERKAAEREERLKRKLSELNRDEEDIDMGFGSSRLEDEADLEEAKVKLSAWDEDDDDDDGGGGGGGGGGKSKRKRGGKKKRGDKNNFEDVMKVIQRQKGGG